MIYAIGLAVIGVVLLFAYCLIESSKEPKTPTPFRRGFDPCLISAYGLHSFPDGHRCTFCGRLLEDCIETKGRAV